MFERRYNWIRPIRSVTVRAIDLISDDMPQQIDMFSDAAGITKKEEVDLVVEDLRARYGSKIIRNAILLNNPKMPGADVLNRQIQMKGL